jgi:hypothetical protein
MTLSLRAIQLINKPEDIGQKSRSSNINEIILRAYGEDKECQSDT